MKMNQNAYGSCGRETIWMTVAQAAQYLGKPKSWLYDNIHRLRIPHARLERQYRFRGSDLNNWVEQRMRYQDVSHDQASP